jgi:hypothetical protein
LSEKCNRRLEKGLAQVRICLKRSWSSSFSLSRRDTLKRVL